MRESDRGWGRRQLAFERDRTTRIEPVDCGSPSWGMITSAQFGLSAWNAAWLGWGSASALALRLRSFGVESKHAVGARSDLIFGCSGG
jgi:hypothetical protein